jgi:hypothetical protein
MCAARAIPVYGEQKEMGAAQLPAIAGLVRLHSNGGASCSRRELGRILSGGRLNPTTPTIKLKPPWMKS